MGKIGLKKLYQRAYKKVNRLVWEKTANHAVQKKGALFGRVGVNVDDLAVRAERPAKIYVKNVHPGRYSFKVSIADHPAAISSKSLTAKFKFENGVSKSDFKRNPALFDSGDGFLSIYLGESCKDGGSKFSQSRTIDISEFQKWMLLELSSNIGEEIYIERLSLSQESPDEERIDFEIFKWVSSLEKKEGVSFILYADIDLNVVDGSSVWLTSMISILSSIGVVVVVLKKPIIAQVTLSNIISSKNIIFISSQNFEGSPQTINVEFAAKVIFSLDKYLPSVRYLVLRGLQAAVQTSMTRQFSGRSVVYLTDFYIVGVDGFVVPDDRAREVAQVAAQSRGFLAQTSRIGNQIAALAKRPVEIYGMPPPIPDGLNRFEPRTVSGAIKIGYAGKINPDWGISELLDWVERLRNRGFDIELLIVANKISDGAVPGFREAVIAKMNELGARFYSDFNRQQSITLMNDMDYIWCWRPKRLEEHTLELSTKLVELAACGGRCICYPSSINRELLGDEYPFFVENYDGFENALSHVVLPERGRANKIKMEHSISAVEARLGEELFKIYSYERTPKICFSGHDFKFIDSYISDVKSRGFEVVRDQWEWGKSYNIDISMKLREWADIIFCEWGLANAVWHSQYKDPSKKLFIRVHLQEINERAKKFGFKIEIDNVDLVIFVSDRVRQEAVTMFGWPLDKTVVIPNFVLTEEYRMTPRNFDGPIRLGMVGIVPQRKRFDLAVDLLSELQRRGYDASLKIKGPRPEALPFMHAPSRIGELEYYDQIYRRIEGDDALSSNVVFEDWGNDVAQWYSGVDYIISSSDFESFHYALADGVLSGCYPLVWPWKESCKIYTEEWSVSDVASAVNKIKHFRGIAVRERNNILLRNRNLVCSRYGDKNIFQALDNIFVL